MTSGHAAGGLTMGWWAQSSRLVDPAGLRHADQSRPRLPPPAARGSRRGAVGRGQVNALRVIKARGTDQCFARDKGVGQTTALRISCRLLGHSYGFLEPVVCSLVCWWAQSGHWYVFRAPVVCSRAIVAVGAMNIRA